MSDTKQFKVLIIDDNADFLDLAEQVMESDMFELHTFLARENTLDIENEIKKISPDFILLDLYLPSGPALPVCESIKKLPEFQNVPLYFISFAERSDLEKVAQGTGADGCLSKPIETKTIEELLEKHYSDQT